MSVSNNYLLSASLNQVPALSCDVLVIGTGISGLSAALAAAKNKQVILVSKDKVAECSTYHAQGGIAAALDKEDSVELHVQDTLEAGAGLCDKDVVEVMVSEGIQRCRELIEWGTPFDKVNGNIAYTMEGAHSRRRILHASGDQTGQGILTTLLQLVMNNSNIRVLENHFVIDLLCEEGVCYGALMQDSVYGRLLRVDSGTTVVGTGGIGRIFRETTNPEGVTGDGYALCVRAGAALRDMEFVQFHPTTLYLAGAPRFLISESVRGEGAYLLSPDGRRFMTDYDEKAELAPRDIVSRSIVREMSKTGATHVCLDLRHLGEELIQRRFPNIRRICGEFGIDLLKDVIPVRPAVHYMMGGVQVDCNAKTRVERLYAVGETASTGVHGANRLASNSLLEGLVFGHKAGEDSVRVCESLPASKRSFPMQYIERKQGKRGVPLDINDIVLSLKSLTWRTLGVFRNRVGLEEAVNTISFWEQYVRQEQFQARGGFEVMNMLTVAKAIAISAIRREESRGAHQREDFPALSDDWCRHTILLPSELE